MVSPASSFGIMDGGLDAAIQDVLGFAIQQRVQRVIVDRHHGELPVGAAGSAELRQLRRGQLADCCERRGGADRHAGSEWDLVLVLVLLTGAKAVEIVSAGVSKSDSWSACRSSSRKQSTSTRDA